MAQDAPTGLPEVFDVGYARVVGSAGEDGPVLRCGLHPQALVARPKTPCGSGRQINNIYDCFALGEEARILTVVCVARLSVPFTKPCTRLCCAQSATHLLGRALVFGSVARTLTLHFPQSVE